MGHTAAVPSGLDLPAVSACTHFGVPAAGIASAGEARHTGGPRRAARGQRTESEESR